MPGAATLTRPIAWAAAALIAFGERLRRLRRRPAPHGAVRTMQVERLALLQLQVAMLDGIGERARQRRVERRVDRITDQHERESIDAHSGECAEGRDLVSKVHNLRSCRQAGDVIRYHLRRDLARNFGATVVVILTVGVDDHADPDAGSGRRRPNRTAGRRAAARLRRARLPAADPVVSLFIAVVATLGRMYRDSEMAIWFSSGIGLTRFVRPVLRVERAGARRRRAACAGGLALGERARRRAEGSLRAPFGPVADRAGTVPDVERRQARLLHRAQSEDGQTGRNVFIVSTETNSESVTSARSGRIEVENDGRYLVLDRGQRNEENLKTGEKGLSRFESYRVLAGERILSQRRRSAAESASDPELLRSRPRLNQGELVWRLGLLLGGANLVLLGIGLSVSNPRHPSNWNLLFALLSFVVYYNVINLTKAWVGSSKIGMGTVLIAAHGGAFLLALALLWWREHTNSRVMWSRRARPPAPRLRKSPCAPFAGCSTPTSSPRSPSWRSPSCRCSSSSTSSTSGKCRVARLQRDERAAFSLLLYRDTFTSWSRSRC